MTGTQLAALIRYKTKTNSTTFTNADMLPLVNAFKDEICSLITQKNNTLFVIPATDNLVADQREYSWPSDVLNHLIEVEAAFTTDTPLKYVTLQAIQRKDFPYGLTEANITSSFSNSTPKYIRRRRAIYILSGTIVAVTNGLRITHRAYPADLPDLAGSTDLALDPSTTTFGFPKQFHELLARRVAIEWKQSRPKPVPLSTIELNYERDLEKQLQAISREDFSEETQFDVPRPYSDGYEL